MILRTELMSEFDIFDTSVEFEGEGWEILFEAIDSVVHQRRNISVLCGIETFEKCFSGMDDEMSDGSLSFIGDDIYEFFCEFIGVELINS